MDNCIFENGCECNVLTEKKCESCSFYKTEAELIEGRRKASERIDNLPEKQRNHIIRKYYK